MAIRLCGLFKHVALLLLLLLSWTGNNSRLQAQRKPSQDGPKTSARPFIGNLKDQNMAEGCGCYFSFPAEERKRSPRFVFFSGAEDGSGWMNIDGQDVKLRLVQSSGDEAARPRIGSKLTRIFEGAGGISVRAIYITSQVCRLNDESCEFTGYRANFTVKKGARQQIVKLTGGCGC